MNEGTQRRRAATVAIPPVDDEPAEAPDPAAELAERIAALPKEKLVELLTTALTSDEESAKR